MAAVVGRDGDAPSAAGGPPRPQPAPARPPPRLLSGTGRRRGVGQPSDSRWATPRMRAPPRPPGLASPPCPGSHLAPLQVDDRDPPPARRLRRQRPALTSSASSGWAQNPATSKSATRLSEHAFVKVSRTASRWRSALKSEAARARAAWPRHRRCCVRAFKISIVRVAMPSMSPTAAGSPSRRASRTSGSPPASEPPPATPPPSPPAPTARTTPAPRGAGTVGEEHISSIRSVAAGTCRGPARRGGGRGPGRTPAPAPRRP